MLRFGASACACVVGEEAPRLIAVTGGPGAGKTAVLRRAAQEMCPHVAILPEAASVLFGGGFPRRPSSAGHHAAQRAIYRVQRELERLVQEEGQVRYVLCDRGTVDAWAYWRGDARDFWREVGSSLAQELGRYDVVLHLHTPSASGGYNHENELRIETPEQANTLDARVLEAWSGHPRRHVVESAVCFEDKAREALGCLRRVMSGE